MKNSLSIIIPTYKRKESLAKLLHALMTQKNISPEIIVVDQNPPGFLNESIPEGSNVKHLILKSPNVSEARNRGFMHASGDIILFIDDDLLPGDEFCSKGMAVFNDYPGIGCFSPLVYNEEGKTLALRQAKSKFIRHFKNNPEIFSITDTISAAIFFRREYYERTGGFDPLLFEFAKTAEDQEFFLRMKKRKLELYYVPFIEIFHDETVPGGCDLRTMEYWVSREKCMRAWAYRHRIHHNPIGSLSAKDFFQLSRSGFLNREVLSSGIKNIRRQMTMLKKAIKSSHTFLEDKQGYYSDATKINHLELTGIIS
jgi:GT2 family glycosyltransferase